LDVLIGDRLEKSVLSLMGLMRTDPPFLRRENKVVKEKTEREINTEKKKVVRTILRKKSERQEKREIIIMDNDHSLRQIFHRVLICFLTGATGVAVFRAG
jgi:hypothetical protein